MVSFRSWLAQFIPSIPFFSTSPSPSRLFCTLDTLGVHPYFFFWNHRQIEFTFKKSKQQMYKQNVVFSQLFNSISVRSFLWQRLRKRHKRHQCNLNWLSLFRFSLISLNGLIFSYKFKPSARTNVRHNDCVQNAYIVCINYNFVKVFHLVVLWVMGKRWTSEARRYNWNVVFSINRFKSRICYSDQNNFFLEL